MYLCKSQKFSTSKSHVKKSKENVPSISVHRTSKLQIASTLPKKKSSLVMPIALSCIIALEPLNAALASEFDILAADEPKTTYYIDDARVLSRTTRDEIDYKLSSLKERTGYKLLVATIRKLEFDPDIFSFSEKVIGKWRKSGGDDKTGLLVIVTANKDGALVGGDSFVKAVGDELIDSVQGDNIPIFTEEEKFNEAALSSINRVVAVLDGKEDPGAPRRVNDTRIRTYKTKEETDRVKPVTGTIVLTLLLIAFVVPMLQYYGYVNKD